MPVVPRYNPGQVNQAPLPGARVSTDAPIEAFGGGAGRVADAAEGLIDVGTKIALKEKAKADDLVVQDAYAQAVRKKNELYWDPKSGAITRKGRDAAGVVDEYNPLFTKELDSISERLNADQRAQFHGIRLRLGTEFDESLRRHSHGEGEKFADDTHKAVIDTTIDDAVVNLAQGAHAGADGAMVYPKIDGALGIIRGKMLDQANRKGWNGEITKEETLKVEAYLHAAVVNQMLSLRQDRTAKQYFEQNEHAFTDEKQKAQVQKDITQAYSQEEAQRQATNLIAASKGDFYAAAKKARETIQDGDIQKLTTQEINLREADFDHAKEKNDKARMLGAVNYVDANRKLPPGNVMSRLELSQRVALQNYMKGNIPTDKATYYRLDRMAGDPSFRTAFIRLPIMNFVDKLDEGDFKHFSNLQSAMERGDDKIGQRLDGIHQKTSLVDANLRDMGLDPTPKESNHTEASKVLQFRESVEKGITEFQRVNNRDVTNEDLTLIIKRLRTGIIKQHPEAFMPWNKTSEAKLFEAGDGDTFNIQFKDIPKDDVRNIEKALVKQLGPVRITEDMVVKWFKEKRYLKQDRKK